MKTHIVFATLLVIVAVMVGFVLPGGVAHSMNAPQKFAIRTSNGHYLTAVGGGGRTTDVIHTDATRIGSWEKFTWIDTGVGSPIQYGIQTSNGHYLTAVGGGGRITDVMHSDATKIQGWETFQVDALGGGVYAIKTVNGHYLTALGGGGHSTDLADDLHSDATQVRSWEQFRLIPIH